MQSLREMCPNTELFLVRKYGPEITPYLDTFHEVNCLLIIQILFWYEASRNSVMRVLHGFFSTQQFLC